MKTSISADAEKYSIFKRSVFCLCIACIVFIIYPFKDYILHIIQRLKGKLNMDRKKYNDIFMIVVILALLYPLHLRIANAQTNKQEVLIVAGDYGLEISRIWEAEEASGREPGRDMFLILDITLHNYSSETTCFYDQDFEASTENYDSLTPEYLSEVRDEFFPDRDYPGGFLGQCVSENSSDLSLLEYDISSGLTSLTIKFSPEEEEIVFTLLLRRQNSGEYLFELQEEEVNQDETVEEQNEESETWHVVGAERVNVRSCASVECGIVTTVGSEDSLLVLSTENGWHKISLSDGQVGYIAEYLTAPASSNVLTEDGDSATEVFEFDEETVILLIRTAMISQEFGIDSIEVDNDNLVVYAPESHDGFNDLKEYRFSFIGALTGATVTAYNGDDVVATPPQKIIVNFALNDLVVVRVSLDYTEAEKFINGDITAMQFFESWDIE